MYILGQLTHGLKSSNLDSSDLFLMFGLFIIIIVIIIIASELDNKNRD